MAKNDMFFWLFNQNGVKDFQSVNISELVFSGSTKSFLRSLAIFGRNSKINKHGEFIISPSFDIHHKKNAKKINQHYCVGIRFKPE